MDILEMVENRLTGNEKVSTEKANQIPKNQIKTHTKHMVAKNPRKVSRQCL